MTIKTIKWLMKAIFSGIIALVLLHFFCLFYYNLPIHFSGKDGATDYVWEKQFSYSNLTEGFGRGKTNNEGYANPFDYTDGMEADIILLGSSHMEAFQVAADESAAAQLRKLRPDDNVYNLGTSGHDFLVCAGNLAAAVEKYQPEKYVIVETSSVSFPDEAVEAVLNGTAADIPSYSDGLIGLLQQNKYFCLLYKQLLALPALINPPANPLAGSKTEPQLRSDPQKDLTVTPSPSLRTLLENMKNSAASSGAKLIIAYHPALTLQSDASAAVKNNPAQQQAFAALCQELDILYLDMTDRFLEEYETRHVLPHGFFNSSVGNGHMNPYGHAMLAEELCRIMSEVE